ncbi:hypothetical protein ORJ66_20380 [Pseudoalteromonas tunicata]|uniref:hypothetical protein n=1 Tax=Pseudoalteromonas tunicata TaxID=314281 RepID=UPI00273FD1AC|nr:hypothetical protein [Pseudoalteromonas tunicata]MDP5215410.1 hypothetical protein [Pseudoalteromonas tunicata]
MGCQYKIGEQIVSNEGNYVLGLKGNQGEIYDDVELHLDTQLNTQFKNTSHSVLAQNNELKTCQNVYSNILIAH